MYSAFGIDHGEVSKAMPKVPGLKQIGSFAAKSTSSAGMKMGSFGAKHGTTGGVPKPGLGGSLSRGIGSLGAGLGTAGKKMATNPLATGVGVAGAGASGLSGGAGYMKGRSNSRQSNGQIR